ncbi:cysteine--tRNA ligase [candidate division KSB1 bacterium]|nr:cysteine--tRNA ligase [candidate division KSB1 bacterium]
MALQVYNYLTRKKEDFKPLHAGFVGMYVCGPTVYGHSHLGHAKCYITFDIVNRYLRSLGYKVRYVQNITDVGHLTDDADEGEDKIGKKARLERLEPMEIVEAYTRSYFGDMDRLNILRPDISPRASGHVLEQIEMAQKLIEKGVAYENHGSVFFSVRDWSGYGKLSGRRLAELEEGSRLEVNPDKRYPADFAVWRAATPEHIMKWNSPWGQGFPGWHAECTVMSLKYLGLPFDIHGGGLENIFPHNESEIAQAEAAYGKDFARYWLLNNMVTRDGTKMGKSLGNSISLKEAFELYDPMAIRFFILSSHYRSNTDFSEKALEAASRGYQRLLNAVKRVRELKKGSHPGAPENKAEKIIQEFWQKFQAALDDDFNTPQAIAVLFDYTRAIDPMLSRGSEPGGATLDAIDSFFHKTGDEILGIVPTVLPEESGAGLDEALIKLIIQLRADARKDRNWALADQLRDRLLEIGIALEDQPDGTTWRLV